MGMSREEQGVREGRNIPSNTSSVADRLHHFCVATATRSPTIRHPYGLSAASAKASRKF